MAFSTATTYPQAVSYSPIAPYNVFIPGYDGEARARLLVEYTLNPKKFALNEYVTILPVTLPAGYYRKVMPTDYVRVPYSDGRNMRWVDGQPSGALYNREQSRRFTNIPYELLRVKQDRNIGWLTQQFSPYDELKGTQNMLASIMMTFRAVQCVNTALNTSFYDATRHVATASALGGGFWSQGTPAQPYFKTALDNIRDVIMQDSIGMVDVDYLRIVLSPTAASAISRSQEIRVFLSEQAGSLDVLTGDKPDALKTWSLPKKYNGFDICVEKAVYVPTLITDNATTALDGTPQYVMPYNSAFVCARPGSLVSEDGGVNFSTIQLLELKGQAFKVFMKDLGEQEQYTYVRVEDFFLPIVAAPETGFVITNLFS
jgi:hypothetical protein